MTPDHRGATTLTDSVPIRLAARRRAERRPSGPPATPRPEAQPKGPPAAGTDKHCENRVRPLPAGLEPLLSLDDLAALLSCSRRLVERMRAAGKVPRPDFHVGRCPRWKPETVRSWIEAGGGDGR